MPFEPFEDDFHAFTLWTWPKFIWLDQNDGRHMLGTFLGIGHNAFLLIRFWTKTSFYLDLSSFVRRILYLVAQENLAFLYAYLLEVVLKYFVLQYDVNQWSMCSSEWKHIQKCKEDNFFVISILN